jgi:hypothetical protein
MLRSRLIKPREIERVIDNHDPGNRKPVERLFALADSAKGGQSVRHASPVSSTELQ